MAPADRAPVPHVVSEARIERHLQGSGVPWTVVAPNCFYENVGAADGGQPHR